MCSFSKLINCIRRKKQTRQTYKTDKYRFTIDDNKLKDSSTSKSFFKKYKIEAYIESGGFGIVCKGKLYFMNYILFNLNSCN